MKTTPKKNTRTSTMPKSTTSATATSGTKRKSRPADTAKTTRTRIPGEACREAATRAENGQRRPNQKRWFELSPEEQDFWNKWGKIRNLTLSPNKREAKAAADKAKSMLREHGYTPRDIPARWRKSHKRLGVRQVRSSRTVAAAAPSAHPALPDMPVEIAALVREVEEILQAADEDQAALTERYIAAGRRLLRIRANTPHGEFGPLLGRAYPHRDRSTLREYMTLAKEFDAADPETKVQLTGLFEHGWGAVLSEIRNRKRREKRLSLSPECVLAENINATQLQIIQGDCRVKLGELPDESIDCVITSLPYYHAHIYPETATVFGGDATCSHDWERRAVKKRQHANAYAIAESGTCRRCGAKSVMLGWEDEVSEYIEHVVDVSERIKRVLKPTGSFWLNIADTFIDGDWALVPHRLAIALKDRGGWYCLDDNIWDVTNRAPQSVTNRFYRNHEYVLRFTKRKNAFFDASAVREPAASDTRGKKKVRFTRRIIRPGTAAAWHRPGRGIEPDGLRHPRSVWSIPYEPLRGEHHSAFSKALVERMLLSSCPEGGVCLDPFAGSGTVGLVALAHRRRAILIEANSECCALANRRIATELGPFKAEIENRSERSTAEVLADAA